MLCGCLRVGCILCTDVSVTLRPTAMFVVNLITPSLFLRKYEYDISVPASLFLYKSCPATGLNRPMGIR
jgi:hypothetical protein